MLYKPDRHEALRDIPWNPQTAVQRLRQIVSQTAKDCSVDTLWPLVVDHDLANQTPTNIYTGAMGVLWSWIKLRQYSDTDLPVSSERLADDIYNRFMKTEAVSLIEFGADGLLPSYWLGETGVLRALLDLFPERFPDYEKRLQRLLANNMTNPTLEPLWGGTGSIITALAQLEQHESASLRDALATHARYMQSALQHNEQYDCGIWEQDLYGNRLHLLGAGHGFVGNLYPFLRGADYLPAALTEWARTTAVNTLVKAADIEGKCANWASNLGGIDRSRDKHLVQWCHGAPGVIISVNPIPVGYSTELDDLLIKAGELIWQAGPLTKGISLCHGTDGNGMALLKLYKRTGDDKWLDRARAFAMHLINATAPDAALWVGEMGYACFLHACLTQDDRFPLLD